MSKHTQWWSQSAACLQKDSGRAQTDVWIQSSLCWFPTIPVPHQQDQGLLFWLCYACDKSKSHNLFVFTLKEVKMLM